MCRIRARSVILIAVLLAAIDANAAAAQQWFSAWTVAQGERLTASMSGTSVRMIVRPTISGSAVRIKLENTLGQSPVVFSAAYIGQVQSGAALAPGTNTKLTFNGNAGLTLASGAGAYSDAVPFPIAAFQRYAVSLDVTTASDISAHSLGLVTNYMVVGAHAADPGANGFAPVPNGDTGAPSGPPFPFYWVTAVDVESSSATGTIVAFGDSITDGECSTRTNNGGLTGTVLPDVYNRWTDLLATRLAGLPASQTKAVADEGIAGNRVVGGGSQTAVARMDNDMLGREGATHVIFLEGTNDIANGATAATVIAADQQIIGSVHAAGLRIIGATILPRGGDGAWTSAMEQQRMALNDWIRHQAGFDGIIDFDAVMQGPVIARNNSVSIPAQWSCFDGVHPNSAGYAAMSAAIDLGLFQSGGGGEIQLVPGSTTPLLQLNGEHFQITGNGTYFSTFTNSRTLSTSGVVGTDLAYPITFPDKIVFLYGDTKGAYQSGGKYYQSASVGPNGADDSIATIPNVDLSQCHYIGDVAQQLAQGVASPNVSYGACPALHYYANPAAPATQHVFQAVQISGLLAGEGEGPFRVPTAGLAYNSRLYMFYVTEYQDTPAGIPHFSLQSILAKSDQDPETWSDTNPPTFTRLYTVSSHPPVADPATPPPPAGDTGEFMFNPPVVMSAATLAAAGLAPGLPAYLQSAASVAFVLGSSYAYNRSNLYLAAFSLADIEAGTSKWFYYKGNNQWSNSEKDSAPLLSGGALGGGASIGNHSVMWNSALQRFIMMYSHAGIQAQFSATPWGPWTDPVTVFNNSDTWGMALLHHPGDRIVESEITVYDSSGNPMNYGSDNGVSYSPNLLDKFTQNADGSVSVYYVISTWNPYETFLMSSRFTPGPPSNPPTVPAASIVNNASYAPGAAPLAPGSIAAIFGTNLTDGTSCLPPSCNPTFGTSGKLNTTMAGTQVTVNGAPAPIFYAAPAQLGIQIPFEATGTSATVVVSVAGQASAPAIVAVAPVSAGIFTATADGKGAGAFTHVNGAAVTPQNPAQRGELVILYVTGLGQVAPAVPTGALPAGTSSTVSPVTLTIGGIGVVPDFAGLAGCCVGLNQINLRVPAGAGPGNAVPVVLSIGGQSSNNVTIAVQ